MQSHQQVRQNSLNASPEQDTVIELIDNPVNFFKSLSDETRLGTLLLLVTEGELCVCELTEALSVSQPKISRHLALLRDQRVITDRKQGLWVYYKINPALPAWAKEILHLAAENNAAFSQPHLETLTNMGNRPQRQQDSCC